MTEHTFSDILIRPQYSEITSRSGVDISSDMGKGINLELPVISANMPNITEHKMAIEMAINGGLGILHRFQGIEENAYDFSKAYIAIKESGSSLVPSLAVGVSIGVTEESKERFETLYEANARIFCIDVAHGHTKMMKKMIELIKSSHPDIIIIAGNVATAEGAIDLCEWGADIIKVGVGGGSVCKTRSNTGIGVAQLTAIEMVKSAIVANKLKCKIISDGGIKTTGDIAKALKYADAVMVGAVLAGTVETPGNVYPEPGTDLVDRRYYKMYGGSASAENKKENRFVEGEMKKVPFKGHAKYLLREIKEGLQSAFSYSGATTLKEFQEKAQLVEISGGAIIESKL